jgi:HAD superfamily hydrolase (TIGR01509 family)
MIKAIIFDIDGVLVDSRDAVVHNTETLMHEFGYGVPHEKVATIGTAHSAESVLLALAPELAADEAKMKRMLLRLRELTRENLQLVNSAPLVRFVPALAKKYRLAAATNRKASASMVLEKFGLLQYFGAVVTSADAPPKPHPKMIELALGKLGVKASEAVFVGDNEEDVAAGKAAGVMAIKLDGLDEKACKKFLAEFL